MINLLLLCTLISCGPNPVTDNPIITLEGPREPKDPRKYTGIDPEFNDQVELFTKITGKTVKDLPIQFGEVGGETNAIGVCNIYWHKGSGAIYREVYIKKEFWDQASEYEKETLILHELGHCVLGRDHTEETMWYEGYNVPVSIMNPYIIGGMYYYDPNRKYYHKELSGSK